MDPDSMVFSPSQAKFYLDRLSARVSSSAPIFKEIEATHVLVLYVAVTSLLCWCCSVVLSDSAGAMAWDSRFHRAKRCPKKAPVEVHTLQVCSVHGSHVQDG